IKTWRFVRSTPRDLGAKKSSNKFACVLGGSVGLAAILVHSTIDFNMHVPANAIVAVTLMALLSSHLRFATERFWFRAGAISKVSGSVVLIGCAGFLACQSARRASESVWLERAALKPHYSPAQVACLKRAFQAESRNPETALNLGEALR